MAGTLKNITPIIAKKSLSDEEILYVVGFLEDDGTFLQLQTASAKLPCYPAFLVGDTVTLPDGEHKVLFMEAIPPFDADVLGIKDRLSGITCGFRYLLGNLFT